MNTIPQGVNNVTLGEAVKLYKYPEDPNENDIDNLVYEEDHAEAKKSVDESLLFLDNLIKANTWKARALKDLATEDSLVLGS